MCPPLLLLLLLLLVPLLLVRMSTLLLCNSLFPMKDEDGGNGNGNGKESSRTAINGSNPLFKRSFSDDRPPR